MSKPVEVTSSMERQFYKEGFRTRPISIRVAMARLEGGSNTGVARLSRVMTEEVKRIGPEFDVVPVVERRREFPLAPGEGAPRVGGMVSVWARRVRRFPNPKAHAESFDVVHALDPCLVRRGVDMVTIHDLLGETREAPRAARWDARWVRRIIEREQPALACVSGTTRDAVLQAWRIRDESRVRVAYAGVDLDTFYPEPASPFPADIMRRDAVNVAYVGDDHPRKQLPLVVSALAEARKSLDQDVHFVRLGPSSHPMEQAHIMMRARELGVTVSQPGFAKDELVRSVFTWSNAFVWASRAEGFGSGPVEAMACGLPVACTPTPVAHEVYGSSAFFASEATPRGLAEAVVRAVDSPRMSEALRMHASKYAWSNAAQAYAGLYRIIASEG